MSTTAASDVVPSQAELAVTDIVVIVAYFIFIIIVGIWVSMKVNLIPKLVLLNFSF